MIGNSGPAADAFPITPSDSKVLKGVRALFIGSAGDVTILTPADNVVEFKNLPDAYTLDVAAKKVMVATTASDIVGLK